MSCNSFDSAMRATFVRWIVPPLAFVAAGCVTLPDNVSYLYGDRYFRARLNTFPTRVTEVDGRSTIRNQNPVPVEPGEHVITLWTAPAAGFRLAETRQLKMIVEPCKRYYIIAERENRLLQDWEPVIDYVADSSGGTCR